MLLNFNLSNLRSSQQSPLFLLDLIMLLLIIFNLSWILFDTLFASRYIQSGLIKIAPDLFGWYRDEVHPDFVVYDLFFVWIFVVELLFRWGVSIYQKEYHRWWFFPFVHWYDVLGCIPIGSFRFLRLLRVFSIVYRLQKFGVIDIKQTPVARFFDKYARVVVEEVSDRVVVNVLENVKGEIKQGNPVVHKIMTEVIKPKEVLLATWMGNRLSEMIEKSYHSRVPEIQGYIDTVISQAIRQSEELQTYNRLPIIGDKFDQILSRVVSQVVFSTVDQLVEDLHGEESTGLLHEGAAVMIDHLTMQEGEMSLFIQSTVSEVIDLVIEEVKIQKWKLEEAGV